MWVLFLSLSVSHPNSIYKFCFEEVRLNPVMMHLASVCTLKNYYVLVCSYPILHYHIGGGCLKKNENFR